MNLSLFISLTLAREARVLRSSTALCSDAGPETDAESSQNSFPAAPGPPHEADCPDEPEPFGCRDGRDAQYYQRGSRRDTLFFAARAGGAEPELEDPSGGNPLVTLEFRRAAFAETGRAVDRLPHDMDRLSKG